MEWIDDKKNYSLPAGWATLSNLVALKPDSELDLKSAEIFTDTRGKNDTNAAKPG